MSFRVLDTEGGAGGGAVQLARTHKYPRSIHVTVLNLDTTNPHAAFVARSRRELITNTVGIPGGLALPVPAATAPAAGNGIQYNPGQGFVTIGGIAASFSTFVLQAWAGELWAAADATNKVQIEVVDSATPES